MSPELRMIRISLLERWADGAEIDAGYGQTADRYPRHIAQCVGPMVRSLRHGGLIDYAGSGYASRPTRRRAIARTWRASDREACRRLAAADRLWLSAHQPAEPSRRERQQTLPGMD